METRMDECEQRFKDFLSTFHGKKILNDHGERVLAVLEGKNPPPYEFEVQPAAICNANCSHCFGRLYKRCEEKLYSFESMGRVIQELLDYKQDGFSIETIKFCGSTGEPLMNPFTTYAINLIGKQKYTRLFTNGLKLGEHVSDEDYLSTIGQISSINISLDASTTETLQKIKPGSKNPPVRIEDIFEAAAKIRKKGARVEFSFAATNQNYQEIANFAKRLKEFQAADCARYRVDMTDRSVSHDHSKEILDLLREAESYGDKDFQVVRIHNEEAVKSLDNGSFGARACGLKCFTQKFWACIGPDACVYPCGHVVAADTPNYGSLLEQSLGDILNGAKRAEVIAGLPNKKCDICSPFSLMVNKVGKYLEEVAMNPQRFRELHDKYAA